MKIRTASLIVASALATFALGAQEPVMGVKDPASLFKSSDAKLNKNKQATMHIMLELLQCNEWDRAGEWLTKATIWIALTLYVAGELAQASSRGGSGGGISRAR